MENMLLHICKICYCTYAGYPITYMQDTLYASAYMDEMQLQDFYTCYSIHTKCALAFMQDILLHDSHCLFCMYAIACIEYMQ